MNYNNFKNDLNNVIDYSNYKFCFDQMIYNFNDKYKPIGKHVDKYYQYYFKNINDLNKINFIKENIMINTSLL